MTWPFRQWGFDFIGQIHPSSSKGHHFVLVTIDHFTKWTDVVPLKNMTHKEVMEFIMEHITHRFGIPQSLMTDQDTSFTSGQVREFIESYKIKLLNSSPYYVQANGQAESSNKILMKPILKIIRGDGMRYYLRHYGLIIYLHIMLLRSLLLSMFMVKKPFYPWR
jgi:transposase InsO family protein